MARELKFKEVLCRMCKDVYFIVEILQIIFVLATKISYTPQAIGSSNQTTVHPTVCYILNTIPSHSNPGLRVKLVSYPKRIHTNNIHRV